MSPLSFQVSGLEHEPQQSELRISGYLQPWAMILEPKLFPDGKLAVLIVEAMFRALCHESGTVAIQKK